MLLFLGFESEWLISRLQLHMADLASHDLVFSLARTMAELLILARTVIRLVIAVVLPFLSLEACPILETARFESQRCCLA